MRDKLYYIFMFIFHHFRFDYAFSFDITENTQAEQYLEHRT